MAEICEGKLKREVCADWMRLEHVSELKYSGCLLEESGSDEA